MPAITRTEPRRMAMLTASREAMNLRNHRKYLRLHPYRRHSSTPTHFWPQRQSARFEGLKSPSQRWYRRCDYGNLGDIRINFVPRDFDDDL
jgi:hypothetical protein